MLQSIKTLLGISDNSKDSLLNVLISKAIDQVVNYTHNPQCVGYLENAIIDIVIYMYNRIGTEGLTSERYTDVQFNYTADYPDSIMKQLNCYRKLRVV